MDISPLPKKIRLLLRKGLQPGDTKTVHLLTSLRKSLVKTKDLFQKDRQSAANLPPSICNLIWFFAGCPSCFIYVCKKWRHSFQTSDHPREALKRFNFPVEYGLAL